MSTNSTITLKAGGERTLVKESEAQEIADRFKQESSNNDVVVGTVDLSCRSWPRASLDLLRPTLEPLVATVTHLKIDDIIASLPTEAGLESLGFFAEVFGSSTVLKDINLADNALGSRGDVVLAPLFQLQSLQRLSIENCGMSREVAESMLQTLSSSAPRLTHLSLGRNQIGAEGAPSVGDLLATCPKLQVLNYNGCRPLKAGTASLLAGLVNMVKGVKETSLSHLNLEDCTIGSEDNGDDENDGPLTNLRTIIAKSPKLVELNLQDGELGASGLQVVLDALKESGAQLTHLSLGACELGEEGAEILASTISNTSILDKLQLLRMDTNELGDDGVSTLSQALGGSKSCCETLKSLDLGDNEIAKSGAVALLKTKIASLESLNLMENMDIPQKVGAKLATLYPKVSMDDDLEEDDDDDEEEDEVDDLAAQLAGAKI